MRWEDTTNNLLPRHPIWVERDFDSAQSGIRAKLAALSKICFSRSNLISVSGRHDLGLVANRHNWIGKPRTFKVFDISHGEVVADAIPELVLQAEH